MSASAKILIVEDEESLSRMLQTTLIHAGYLVTAVKTAKDALAQLAAEKFGVVLLDLGLPDMDGTDVISGVRGWSSVPVLVLSARDQEAQKVAALDAGADDYVTKPFGMDELLARLRAAVRRATPAPEQPVVETGGFVVDLAAKRVTRPDTGEVRLTPTEWQLLELLARHADRLVSQQQLLREVWGPGYDSETHYLRVYMAQLRRKLEPDPSRPRYLITEPAMGYRLVTSAR
jgi:two-component system KDP operon response regulator KdpE